MGWKYCIGGKGGFLNTIFKISVIFFTGSSLVISSEAHFFPHVNCHHQISYSKWNFKIKYPPPFQRLVWNVKKADITSISFYFQQHNNEYFRTPNKFEKIKTKLTQKRSIHKSYISNGKITRSYAILKMKYHKS